MYTHWIHNEMYCNSIRLTGNRIRLYLQCELGYLIAVVGPRSELDLALLVVEGEPGDVDLARALEDARRDVVAAAVAAHHHVRLVRAVELLVGAARRSIVKYRLISRASIDTRGTSSMRIVTDGQPIDVSRENHRRSSTIDL